MLRDEYGGYYQLRPHLSRFHRNPTIMRILHERRLPIPARLKDARCPQTPVGRVRESGATDDQIITMLTRTL